MTINDIKSNETLKKYMDLVLKENEVMNLTSITDEEEFYDKHFYDSLFVIDSFDFKNKVVMDLGSGAGFPGIPLAIVLKDTTFYLVEPMIKRCNFLNKVVQELDLKNVIVVNKRAEDLDDSFIEKFDFITSRAVSKLNILLELSAKFLKIGGNMIFLKGLKYQEEVEESKNAFKILNLNYIKTLEATLPFSKETRFYIIVKKLGKTNPQYPRPYQKIKKKPL